MEVKKKRCPNCKNEKEIKEFSKNSSRPDGLNSQCKKCHSDYRKDYYKKNKEREKELAKKYKEINPAKPSNNDIQVNCIVCEKLIWRRIRDIKKNKTKYHFCSNECRSEYQSKDVIEYYLKETRKRATVKKIKCEIDADFLNNLFYNKQKEKCAITGVDIKLIKRKNKRGIHEAASLDRIDSDKGYTKNNVRFVVLGINYMKNNRPDWQLFELLKKIKNA